MILVTLAMGTDRCDLLVARVPTPCTPTAASPVAGHGRAGRLPATTIREAVRTSFGAGGAGSWAAAPVSPLGLVPPLPGCTITATTSTTAVAMQAAAMRARAAYVTRDKSRDGVR